MGWFTNNDVQLPAGALGGKDQRHAKRDLRCAAILAVALLAPLQASAIESRTAELDRGSGMQKLSENDLRDVSARGLADRFLERVSKYATNGFAVEVLGDMATLLNPFAGPFAGLFDADVSYKDAVFNPNFPSMLVDRDGSVLIRLPVSIGEISIRNIRIRGSNGASFGSITIRDLNFYGSTIRVTRH